MSILFSRQCEYALQAVLYLALRDAKEKTSIKELTDKLDIPYHFLGKILQDLTRKGLLQSLKGRTGGFALARPSHKITLLDIVEAIDGTTFTRSCILGFSECSSERPCAVHNDWKALRENIRLMLINKSIAEMAHDMKKPEYLAVDG